jgi:hypothetical protein
MILVIIIVITVLILYFDKKGVIINWFEKQGTNIKNWITNKKDSIHVNRILYNSFVNFFKYTGLYYYNASIADTNNFQKIMANYVNWMANNGYKYTTSNGGLIVTDVSKDYDVLIKESNFKDSADDDLTTKYDNGKFILKNKDSVVVAHFIVNNDINFKNNDIASPMEVIWQIE